MLSPVTGNTKSINAWRAFLWVSSSHCACLLTLGGCAGCFYVHRTSCQRLCQTRKLEWLHTAVLGPVTPVDGFAVTITTRTPRVPLACIDSTIFVLLAAGEGHVPFLHRFWELIPKGFGFSLASSFWFCATLHWSFYSVCYCISLVK